MDIGNSYIRHRNLLFLELFQFFHLFIPAFVVDRFAFLASKIKPSLDQQSYALIRQRVFLASHSIMIERALVVNPFSHLLELLQPIWIHLHYLRGYTRNANFCLTKNENLSIKPIEVNQQTGGKSIAAHTLYLLNSSSFVSCLR